MIKRRWGQHRLMTGAAGGPAVGGTRSVMFTQTTLSVAEPSCVPSHQHGRQCEPPPLYDDICRNMPTTPPANSSPSITSTFHKTIRNGQQPCLTTDEVTQDDLSFGDIKC